MQSITPEEAELLVSFIGNLSLPDLQFYMSGDITSALELKTALRKLEVHLLARGAGRLSVKAVINRAVSQKVAVKNVIENQKGQTYEQKRFDFDQN